MCVNIVITAFLYWQSNNKDRKFEINLRLNACDSNVFKCRLCGTYSFLYFTKVFVCVMSYPLLLLHWLRSKAIYIYLELRSDAKFYWHGAIKWMQLDKTSTATLNVFAGGKSDRLFYIKIDPLSRVVRVWHLKIETGCPSVLLELNIYTRIKVLWGRLRAQPHDFLP